jgi:hypothetical protein
MLDRQKIESILSRRFPGSSHDQVAAAANAIMGLSDEWEEVAGDGGHFPKLVREADGGLELRLFRRREAH